jgi:hypothetical protein
MTDDVKQEREGVNVEWLAQQLLDWPDKRTDETKTMAIGTLHRMASATLLSLYREVAALRQPQTDATRWRGMRKNWELSHGPVDDEEGAESAWRVHSVNGGRNDREWTLLGIGETPEAAVDAALGQSK